MRLLEEHRADDVALILAQPAPLGFSIPTSKASVNRFRRRYLQRQRDQLKENDINFTKELIQNAPVSARDCYLYASEQLLQLRLLRAAKDPETDDATLHTRVKTLTTLRKQLHTERK
jgi:hypothetical protein